jgi:hypothetical protein
MKTMELAGWKTTVTFGKKDDWQTNVLYLSVHFSVFCTEKVIKE